MAAGLPDNWLTQVLDAYAAGREPAGPPGRRGHQGVKGSASHVRFLLHTSGIAYGTASVRPVLVEGLAQDPIVRAAAHLLDVAMACASRVLPRPVTAQPRALLVGVLAVALDKDVAMQAAFSSPPPPLKRRARQEEELGKALKSRLEAMLAPALGVAVHGALLAAEARSWARIMRRLALLGAASDRDCRRLRGMASLERVHLVRHVVLLQRALEWPVQWSGPGFKKFMVAAGAHKAHVKLLLDEDMVLPTAMEAGGVFAAMAVTQVMLEALMLERITVGDQSHLSILVAATGFKPVRVARLQRRAARVLLHAAVLAREEPDDAGQMAGAVAEWTSRTVVSNLDAVVQEIRETGELASLLARAASGHALTPDEWRKVREQLLDVARAVPSLAVFALPGGAFLLPLLLKVLPFDIRPSSFRPRPDVPPPSPKNAALPPAGPPPRSHP